MSIINIAWVLISLERFLHNVSNDNMQFVQSQLDKLYDDFMRYLDYWNEKYYRNELWMVLR